VALVAQVAEERLEWQVEQVTLQAQVRRKVVMERTRLGVQVVVEADMAVIHQVVDLEFLATLMLVVMAVQELPLQ